MLRIVAVCVAALLASTLAAGAQEYLVRPGDRLSVSVLEDPSLSGEVLVRPDGRISLPLAGTIEAGGRTPEAIQSLIRQRLSRDFVSPPTVTVSLIALSPDELQDEAGEIASIYVLGQVARPGVYDVPLPTDALRVLALAGGPSVFAALERIQIRRRGEGGEQLFLFNYEVIEDGLVPGPVVSLFDGDVIVVPERGLFE